MSRKNPVHPGEIIRHECIEASGLSVSRAAKVLGVSRQGLINVLNGESAVSPEMAVRLEKAFGSTADTWLNLQNRYDLAHINRDAIKVAPVAMAAE